MSTYAIGDIHGCFETLERLLARVAFDAKRDRLWLVGDLVNRGPRSLEVLRFAYDAEASLVSVLGNHDVHLLAVANGIRRRKPRDTFDEILRAPDRNDLLAWLRARPLIHGDGKFTLVHAGLHPQWTLADAADIARRVERTLQSASGVELLSGMYEEASRSWVPAKATMASQQAALRFFTSARVCEPDGRIYPDFTGPPVETPAGYLPWFELPERRAVETEIICGHWAALGYFRGRGIVALDTGCAWGYCLTALRLEDGTVYQEPLADRSP